MRKATMLPLEPSQCSDTQNAKSIVLHTANYTMLHDLMSAKEESYATKEIESDKEEMKIKPQAIHFDRNNGYTTIKTGRGIKITLKNS